MFSYRSLLAAVAAMGLAGAVFADDAATTATQPAAAPTTATAPAAADQTKVDLNKATAKDLAKVKGLNATKAKAIIAYRKKNGDFKNVADLKQVKGFKRMKAERFQQIEDQLMVN